MNISDEELVELFFEIIRLNRRQVSHSDASQSYYAGQYRCIFALENTGPLPQKKLAGLLQIRSTSLSELMLKLEKKGIIKRTPSQEDKRTMLVSLTEVGLEKAAEYRKLQAKAHRELVYTLSPEEKGQFHSILTKMKRNYESMEEK